MSCVKFEVRDLVGSSGMTGREMRAFVAVMLLELRVQQQTEILKSKTPVFIGLGSGDLSRECVKEATAFVEALAELEQK